MKIVRELYELVNARSWLLSAVTFTVPHNPFTPAATGHRPTASQRRSSGRRDLPPEQQYASTSGLILHAAVPLPITV